MAERHRLRAAGRARRELDDRLARRRSRARSPAGTACDGRAARSPRRPRSTSISCVALGRGNARVQRDERAADAPHREPRGDRARRVRGQHADRAAVRAPASRNCARELVRPSRAARRASSRPRRGTRRRRRGRRRAARRARRRSRTDLGERRRSLTAGWRPMRIGLSGASTINVRCTSVPSATSRCRHCASAPRSHARSNAAHVARSGIAQITIASLSVAIITRNAPTHCRPSSSTAGRPVSASASRNAPMPPIGVRTISCAYTSPFTPAFVSSSIVGLHRSGATMRSKPPRRSSAADRPPLGQRRILRAAARRARARSSRPDPSSR